MKWRTKWWRDISTSCRLLAAENCPKEVACGRLYEPAETRSSSPTLLLIIV